MQSIAFLCLIMKKRIFEFGKKLNIEFMGVAPVMRYQGLEADIISRKEKYGLSVFEEEDIEKRVDPKKTFPWAKSIIVALFPYYTGKDNESNISCYARIPDYHKVVEDKLNEICKFIKAEQNAVCEPFVDRGVLHDRYLAYLAGLGIRGVNTCLINEKYGTYFFIGYIVTDLELECDKPIEKECKKCMRCVKACSGKALDGEYHLDVNRCVSYITQLKKLTDEQKEILASQSMIYGCDKCQESCPYNENAIKTPIMEFYEKKVLKLKKEELEHQSNKEFKEKYGDFPFSWRGKGSILKNFDK